MEVVQEGGHGLVGLQFAHHAQVRPGLIHDDDDVGQVLLLPGLGVTLGHPVHMTGGVAVGLLHHRVPDAQVEVQVVAVVLGAVVGPVADGDVPGAHIQDHRHGHDPGEGDCPAELSGLHGEGGHGQSQEEHQHHAHQGIEHGVLIGLQLVLAGHVHGSAGGHDVHGGELVAPELVDQAVDHRQDSQAHRGDDHRELELGSQEQDHAADDGDAQQVQQGVVPSHGFGLGVHQGAGHDAGEGQGQQAPEEVGGVVPPSPGKVQLQAAGQEKAQGKDGPHHPVGKLHAHSKGGNGQQAAQEGPLAHPEQRGPCLRLRLFGFFFFHGFLFIFLF